VIGEGLYCALSGLGGVGPAIPRALPWAGLFGPVGGAPEIEMRPFKFWFFAVFRWNEQAEGLAPGLCVYQALRAEGPSCDSLG